MRAQLCYFHAPPDADAPELLPDCIVRFLEATDVVLPTVSETASGYTFTLSIQPDELASASALTFRAKEAADAQEWCACLRANVETLKGEEERAAATAAATAPPPPSSSGSGSSSTPAAPRPLRKALGARPSAQREQ